MVASPFQLRRRSREGRIDIASVFCANFMLPQLKQDYLPAALQIAGEHQPKPKKRECATHGLPGAVSMSQVPLRGEQQSPALNAPVALKELPGGDWSEPIDRRIRIVLGLAGI